jgi:hypothetical protein
MKGANLKRLRTTEFQGEGGWTDGALRIFRAV